MALSKKLVGIGIGMIVGLYPLPFSLKTSAQNLIPSIDRLASIKEKQNIDELPDDPQQSTSWACQKGNSRIAVDAKDIKHWKTMIEGEGWQCAERTSDVSPGDVKLSCEPTETIGILTVFWLQGMDGEQQLNSWKDDLTAQGMVCTFSKVTPLGSENNAF